ncbi:16461_t:CDS:2 [Dentiscutata erythropus]|uniref:16461_t:CDS:1 n=1 Tax=Dentiscutata erythropus TaxID=1348616 RepID=A0A9N9G3C8_9GLOM|nr:16461_t:CDS:2 [Dentiscutata erythropus]
MADGTSLIGLEESVSLEDCLLISGSSRLDVLEVLEVPDVEATGGRFFSA